MASKKKKPKRHKRKAPKASPYVAERLRELTPEQVWDDPDVKPTLEEVVVGSRSRSRQGSG